MGITFFFDWEIALIKWFQSLESTFLNILSNGAAMLGEEYFLLLILGACYWSFDKSLGRKISMSLVGSLMCGSMLKCIVRRLRPYIVDAEIRCIRAPHPDEDMMSVTAQGYSFPSLHSSMSVSTYTTIAAHEKKRLFTVIAVVLPFIIGITRVYLGVHFPTDVLAGWAMGLVSTMLLLAIEKRWGYKAAFVAMLVMGLPGFFYCNENDFYTCYGIALGMLLGFTYEEQKVQFAMPEKTLQKILRLAIGILLFVIISLILKLPVADLDEAEHVNFLYYYRMFRYALTAFVITGLYPRVFRHKFLR